MKLLFATGVILGAALALSVVAFFLVNECRAYLDSPSWRRKQIAFALLITCQAVFLTDLVINHTGGRWIDVIYSALFLLALGGFVDSYRMLLKSLAEVMRTATQTE